MRWTTSSGLQAPSRYTLQQNLRHQPKCLQYILENFSHAPSRDLEPATLHMLVQLMCGQVAYLDPHPNYSDHLISIQARECLYEKAVLVGGEEELVLAQEAAHLSQAYHQVLVAMQQAQDYVPFSWLSLVQVGNKQPPCNYIY